MTKDVGQEPASLLDFISPTHKRTMGRAPVWTCSEFPTKAATPKGGSAQFAAELKSFCYLAVRESLPPVILPRGLTLLRSYGT
jgi:hypothetical protein